MSQHGKYFWLASKLYHYTEMNLDIIRVIHIRIVSQKFFAGSLASPEYTVNNMILAIENTGMVVDCTTV